MKGSKVRAAGVALVSVALAGLAASPALASPGVTVGSVSSLEAGAKAGTLRGEVVNRTDQRGRRQGHACASSAPAPPRSSSAPPTVRVPANASAAYSVAVKLPERPEPRQLLPGGVHAVGTAPATSGARRPQKDIRIKGGTPVRGAAVRLPALATGAQAAQARDLPLGRAHARQARRARLSGDRQRRLRQRPQRRLHQLRRAHEPVPAGHARRPAAALDAVPERLQPRLRPPQLDHQHDRPGPGLHGRLDHGQRPAGDVQVRPADLPGRSRTARTIPIRWRTAPAW